MGTQSQCGHGVQTGGRCASGEISAEFGKKRVMYPAKLIKKNDGHYLRWDDDEGSISKLLSNGKVYSGHCAKSKPHCCPNCNPHVSFAQLN